MQARTHALVISPEGQKHGLRVEDVGLEQSRRDRAELVYHRAQTAHRCEIQG
jgi:hypothetical protein